MLLIFFLQAEELRQPLRSRVSENNNHWGGVLPKKQQTALERGDVGKGSRFLLHTEMLLKYGGPSFLFIFQAFSHQTVPVSHIQTKIKI